MTCFHPITAFRSLERNASGKRPLVFDSKHGYQDRPLTIPCGHCLGCRIERARQWAVRCCHESASFKNNCFLTLTYKDEELHYERGNETLHKEDMDGFLKRLRKHIYPGRIRYYQCGEYGSRTKRPHHHVLLFGYRFSDTSVYSATKGVTYYESQTLNKIWGKGKAIIGDLTFDSCNYTAGYVIDKIQGPTASSFYNGRVAPYSTMSRRPGLGNAWYTSHEKNLAARDQITFNCLKIRPPKYYDYLRTKSDPDRMEVVKMKRLAAMRNNPELTPERLAVREECLKLKKKSQKRKI